MPMRLTKKLLTFQEWLENEYTIRIASSFINTGRLYGDQNHIIIRHDDEDSLHIEITIYGNQAFNKLIDYLIVEYKRFCKISANRSKPQIITLYRE